MLQELAGLAKIDTQLYLKTLSEYELLIQGRILQEANRLLVAEGQQCKSIDFQASLLKKESVQNILSNLKDLNNADSLFSETKSLKQNHGQTMETTQQKVLEEPSLASEPPESIAAHYKNWFKNFHVIIQDFFVDMYNAKSDFPVGQLPHVSAFLGYVVTRIYERNNLHIKYQDNDLFDRAYFTDAAVVDILVTNDKTFIATARRVPNKTFKVKNLDELALCIHNWHTTN